MFLAQDITPPPPDTPALIGALIMVLSALAYLARRWADGKYKELEIKYLEAETRVQTLKQQLETGEHPAVQDILYIDDSPTDFELFAHLLRSTGSVYNLIWKHIPNDGYIYLRENSQRVAFVLVDMKMVQNGERFLDMVKTDYKTREVPIIVVSGVVPEDITIYKRGAIGYIPKPIQLSSLMQILARHGFSWTLSIPD